MSRLVPLCTVLVALAIPSASLAQDGFLVRGRVSGNEGASIPGVMISINELGLRIVSGPSGAFELAGAPRGVWTLRFEALGYESQERSITLGANRSVRVDVTLMPAPIRLSDLIVRTASRVPERVVDAPAAVSVVDRGRMADLTITGQAPQALRASPGVDVTQSGMQDFNVNMRGFNTSLNRRVLVLQDGRDLSLALLGPQEWGSMTNPLGDYGSVEVLRGPGSALYGANAYSGVIDARTYRAREVVGTKAAFGTGELGTLRADLRHARLFARDRLGVKVSIGYNRSNSWTRSRTAFDRRDLAREYGRATDAQVPDDIEALPLFGQVTDVATGSARGEADPVQSLYATGRVDFYGRDGSLASVEGGASKLQNSVYVTDSGRIQIDEVTRPWVRLAWDREKLNLSAWYTGRNTGATPQRSLLSGGAIVDKSSVMQVEGQTNLLFAGTAGRLVLGASARSTRASTEGTLFSPEQDDRNDTQGSVFGQVEYEPVRRVKVVFAARFDDGSLFEGQFSPRAAVVFTPTEGHSIRLTLNRAFLTPTQIEKYIRLPAGPPADLTLVEAGMREAFGEALTGVEPGALFSNSSAVPVLTLGNESLDVEGVTGLEIGYKGQWGERLFLTADLYVSDLTNFVTDLLPGANPNYRPWTAPTAVPAELRSPLESAVRGALGPGLASAGLTRLDDGSTAIVLSFGNAGDAVVYGGEVGAAFELDPRIRIEGNYTYFGFDVDASSLLPGTDVKANSPRHQTSLGATYRGFEGLSVGADLTVTSGYDWASGVFAGFVPSRHMLDLRSSYRLGDHVRVQAVVTNLLDQERFHVFGGSVIRRRFLAGLTWVL